MLCVLCKLSKLSVETSFKLVFAVDSRFMPSNRLTTLKVSVVSWFGCQTELLELLRALEFKEQMLVPLHRIALSNRPQTAFVFYLV